MSVKLIPKHGDGDLVKRIKPWHTLNYKKWGLNEYNDPEFSASFGKARRGGEKEFVWKDNRYTTNTLDREHEDEYTNGIKWILDFYKNMPLENIRPNAGDTALVYKRIYDFPAYVEYDKRKKSAVAEMDSLEKIALKDPDWYDVDKKYDKPEFKNVYDSFRKFNKAFDDLHNYVNRSADSLFQRLPQDIKQDYVSRSLKLGTSEGPRLVPTLQPKAGNSTKGYWSPKDNKIYASVEGAVPEHEYNHYITLNRRGNLLPKGAGTQYTNPGLHDDEYIDYVMEPTEISSRNIEAKRILSKTHPELSPYKKLNEREYNGVVHDILKGDNDGKNLLYSTWKTFDNNYNTDLVK